MNHRWITRIPALAVMLVMLAAGPAAAAPAPAAPTDPVKELTRPVGDDNKALRARGKQITTELGKLTRRQKKMAGQAAAARARLKALDAEIAELERKLAAHKAKHGEKPGTKKQAGAKK